MPHILLAESDALTRIKLEWTLKDLDFTVTVAGSPEELGQALATTRFSLAILSPDFLHKEDSSSDTRFIRNGPDLIPVLTIDRFFPSTSPHPAPPATQPQPLAPPDMLNTIMRALDVG